jgi:YbgC/YbaW family acyl-CoA thioester hydrolase
MAQAFTGEELEGDSPPRFVDARPIRFQDIDAAGIVFYPRVLEYFHDAYTAWLAAGGYDLRRVLDEGKVGFPLVHAEADYRRPLRFGDRVTVEILAPRMGESSFTLGYRVRLAGGKLAATGQTSHVCIDRATFRPCPLPDDLYALLETSY